MAEESRISDDLGFLQTAEASLRIKNQEDMVAWLQGDVQRLIPHEVFIAAWGDFEKGCLDFDVVQHFPRQITQNPHFYGSSAASIMLPCSRGQALPKGRSCGIVPFLISMFLRWRAAGCAPVALMRDQANDVAAIDLVCSNCNLEASTRFQEMNSTLVHGLSDHRGKGECIYVFLSFKSLAENKLSRNLRFMLPYIDFSLRQVAQSVMQVTESAKEPEPAPEPVESAEASTLSQREIEIMDWVRVGKTNFEVGVILNISAFTVKNHLQRIFKKLDAANRAQAVERMARLKRTA
jgi:transcriptional regulator EpsA